MRVARLITTVALGVLSIAPAYAQGRGGGHVAPPPAVHGTPHAETPKPHPGAATPAPTSGSSQVNPVAQKISANPQLESHLTPLLPPGITLDEASAGFRNQGQFIAALYVSNNLKIPFTELKAAMLGTGGARPLSLGQAIQKLRPNADADAEARRATSEADAAVSANGSSRTSRK